MIQVIPTKNFTSLENESKPDEMPYQEFLQMPLANINLLG